MAYSRFTDHEKQDQFLNETVPMNEQMIEQAGEGKWLMGTDDLTLLDLMVGACWDFLFVQLQASANSECAARINLQQNSPRWWAYMERIRAHPKIANTCMRLEAAEKYATRARGWPEGEKCHISLENLTGVFPDLP